MEALIFAMIAARNGYTSHQMFVPEPAKFQPFDLRALRHFYSAERDGFMPRRGYGAQPRVSTLGSIQPKRVALNWRKITWANLTHIAPLKKERGVPSAPNFSLSLKINLCDLRDLCVSQFPRSGGEGWSPARFT